MRDLWESVEKFDFIMVQRDATEEFINRRSITFSPSKGESTRELTSMIGRNSYCFQIFCICFIHLLWVVLYNNPDQSFLQSQKLLQTCSKDSINKCRELHVLLFLMKSDGNWAASR